MTNPDDLVAATETRHDAGRTRGDRVSTATALLEVIVCSGFPTQIALSVGLAALGVHAVDQGGNLSLHWVALLSLSDTALLVALIWFFLWRHDEPPQVIFLGARPLRAEIQLGVLLIPVIVVSAALGLTLLRLALPGLQNIPVNPMESLIGSPVQAVAFAVIAVAAGAVREELQRAFVIHRFEQYLGGPWLGVAFFSVVFGIGHQIQGWDAAVVTGALGACWGAMYVLRRSVAAAMVSHAGFNLAEIVLVASTIG